MKISLFVIFCLGSIGLHAAPELLEIRDPGNPGKRLPFTQKNGYSRGRVNRPYRIAKNEVTNRDYAEFLNARGKNDSGNILWHPSMKISRTGSSGAFVYVPVKGFEDKGVNYVSRIAAAQYCNHLSGAEVYRMTDTVRPNGSKTPGIAGWRDRTTPTAKRLYFLPDMHEFYKAAYYDGKGSYRDVTIQNRSEPSRYGLLNYASGSSEWMDNKVWGGAPFLLGAHDKDSSPEALSTVKYYQATDTFRDAKTGFRVAATAETDLAPFLPGSRRNFYFDPSVKEGTFRIRRDGDAPVEQEISLRILNHRKMPVYSEKKKRTLNPGVNDFSFPMPSEDGYYELEIGVSDPVWSGRPYRIPFALMREKLPQHGPDGHFGFTIHLQRWMNSYTLETPDYDIIRNIGTSIIRNDFGNGRDGSRDLFQTVRKEGFLPLAILGAINYEKMRKSCGSDPALLKKWAGYGVEPEFALSAEEVFNAVSAYKKDIRHWELGNEPTYWRITAEEYAQYAKAMTRAIRLADPKAVVMLGDVNAIGRPVFALGGADAVDGIASHIYGFYVPGFWGIIGKMRAMNGWKKSSGVEEKSVWLTEIGVSTYSDVHNLPKRSLEEVRRYEAIHVVKSMLGGLAFGAEKVLPYTFRSVPLDFLEEDFGLCDRYGRPNPGVASFRTVSRLFGRAIFKGFVKGGTDRIGGIAALCFRDPDGEDVLVLWRNDLYGTEQRFELPFEKIIHPPELFELKSSSDADVYSLGGGKRRLSRKNGVLSVPVDEYPVFLKGKIRPELTAFQTVRESDARPVSRTSVVRIVDPEKPAKSCDALSGIFLTAAPGEHAKYAVRLFNPGKKTLSGKLKLSVTGSWREWGWKISPSEQSVEIRADGMVGVSFSIAVPEHAAPGTERYVTAVFESAEGEKSVDRVSLRIVRPVFTRSEWINYRKGYDLSLSPDQGELVLNGGAGADYYGNIYRANPPVFASNADELKKTLTLSYRSDIPGLCSLSLLFIDAKNEYFQLKQDFTPRTGVWSVARFQTEQIGIPRKFNAWGGDRKIDYPVRFLGFNFEFKKGTGNRSVRIRMFQIR